MNVDSVLKCFLLVQSQREQCFHAWGGRLECRLWAAQGTAWGEHSTAM